MPSKGEYVGTSKNPLYENPCTVTGGSQHTGVQQAPKIICN